MERRDVALLTGAGVASGRAIALALAARGTELWLVGCVREKLEAVAEAARRTVADVRRIQLDLVCDEDIIELAARLRQETGYVDLLVHCAAKSS